jgi:hypothetical protein
MDPYGAAMVSLLELHAHAPTIAAFVEEKIERTGLCFLATTRADGWPRVSPLELSVCDGWIYMGSMPGAMKALDLDRDGRCCLITPLADRDDVGGEGKLFCRARRVEDVAEHEAVRAVFTERTGYDMGELGAAPVFRFEIEGAAHQRLEGGDSWRTTSWSPERGVRELGRGATGDRVEL